MGSGRGKLAKKKDFFASIYHLYAINVQQTHSGKCFSIYFIDSQSERAHTLASKRCTLWRVANGVTHLTRQTHLIILQLFTRRLFAYQIKERETEREGGRELASKARKLGGKLLNKRMQNLLELFKRNSGTILINNL